MTFRVVSRTLRRSPWYTVTAVVTIGITTALAATVFAIVDGVLFKPLPYAAPDQLYALSGTDAASERTGYLSWLDVQYIREADPRISASAIGRRSSRIHPTPETEVRSVAVDEHFFDVLGQYPLVGGFSDEHFRRAPEDVSPTLVIVTHAFWRQYLSADHAVVGETVEMVGMRLQIVGVLPQDFVFPYASSAFRVSMLEPYGASPAARSDRWQRNHRVVARLGQGITLSAAQSRIDAALAARVGEYPMRESRLGPYEAIEMSSLEARLGVTSRRQFGIALGGVLLLVLLGALNVAALVSARIRDRASEFALRAALGARPRDLMVVVLREAVVVAVAGAAVGLVVTGPLLRATYAAMPTMVLLKEPAVDWRVAAFALVIAVVPLVLAALWPLVTAARRATSPIFGKGGEFAARVRGRRVLLGAQCAAGVVLVLAGALLVASFATVRAEDVGFDSDHTAVVYAIPVGTFTPVEWQAREPLILARMQRVPGVRTVAAIDVPLFQRALLDSAFEAPREDHGLFNVTDIAVSDEFFNVAGLEVINGRVPTVEELAGGEPFVVVSERLARRYWPDQRAVGQTLRSEQAVVTVVGVVENVRIAGQWQRVETGEIYLPSAFKRDQPSTYLLRTVGSPDQVVRDVARVLAADIPGVVIRLAESVDAALIASVLDYRFRALVSAAVVASTLVLLLVGVTGLVATGVATRFREMGIRAALGARRPQLIGLIVMGHLKPAIAGAAAGLLVSWWTVPFVSAYLYEVDAHDPVLWITTAITVVAAAAAAAWVPARRASRVDPTVILKAE